MSPTHCIALFSRESLASDLANRLNKFADVPVAPDDGLSRFMCRSCKIKLVSIEYIRTTAKASYEKNKVTLIATGKILALRTRQTGNELVYGLKGLEAKYTITTFLVMANACALTELQWRPGRLFSQTLIDGLGTRLDCKAMVMKKARKQGF